MIFKSVLQLYRFQEIAGALDSTLMAASVTPVDNLYINQGKSQILTLKQSVMLLESLRLCWSEDVLVISCSDKFLRLSLQLLSRSGLDFFSHIYRSAKAFLERLNILTIERCLYSLALRTGILLGCLVVCLPVMQLQKILYMYACILNFFFSASF